MITKIGFIGNTKLKPVLDQVADEFSDVQLTYYFYETEQETEELVDQAEKKEDILLFGGPVPYFLISTKKQKRLPMLYISYDGGAFYRGLLEVIFHLGQSIENISVDGISIEAVTNIYENLNVGTGGLHIHHEKNHSGQELADYHKNLFQQNKVQCVLTCVNSTYEQLREEGIPSVLILATESAIREGIQRGILENRSQFYKKSQIAVGYLRCIDSCTISDYQQQQNQLTHHHQLLHYSKDIHADLFSVKQNEFLFYTTRGMLESKNIDYLRKVLKELKNISNCKIHIGFGFGSSAQIAGDRARKAIEYASLLTGDQCFLIENDLHYVNLLQQNDHSYRSNDEQISAIAETYQISAIVVTRIVEAIQRLGKAQITAEELSKELNQTPRNTRRTLKELVNKGLAIQVGEEHFGGKGRPKMVYRLTLAQQIEGG